MTTPDLSVMAEATRLTREGRLNEATALLQRPMPVPHAGSVPLLSPTVATMSTPDAHRPYLVHVPPGLAEPAPVIVMLHGGTQDAATFAAATGMNALADQHGFSVVYPEQLASANPMKYWNWFSPNDQQRGRGEPSILADIVGEVIAAHPVDPERVYVAGFSAGAAMASVLAATYPDVFAGLGVHSGLAYRAADNMGAAFTAMRSAPAVAAAPQPMPVIVFHGDADATVDHSNATSVLTQFCPPGLPRVSEKGSAGRPFTRVTVGSGRSVGELWTVHGAGHAWSGGASGGSYADPSGPSASAEFVRFFAQHRRAQP